MSSGSSNSKEKEKARVSRTSLILWHAHQNDAAAVRKLLQEDPSLVNATDYDNRTPLHVASLHGWIDVANCLLEFGADVNAQDRWKNTVRNRFFLVFDSNLIHSFSNQIEVLFLDLDFFNSLWRMRKDLRRVT